MKHFCIIVLFIVLISCISNEEKHTQNNKFAEMIISPGELIDVEFDINWTELARFNDSDMKQNVVVVYWSESDVIKNIEEIEPNQKVIEILDRPFETVEHSILSDYSERLFNGINELLNIFEINISQDMVDKFNSTELYKIIRIKIKNLNIYVYRNYNEFFKLFVIEYDNDLFYEPKLKIEYSKTDIINLLENPSAYSEERNIFIYISHKTGRQINIFFDNENIKNIQLISWGGI
jgi:hypothetical protein